MKKAISGPMFLLVLTLFAIGIYFFINSSWMDAMLRSTDKTACRASVDANAPRIYEGFDFVVSDIKCPPHVVKINSPDPEKVFPRLANSTYQCWDDFRQGAASLFRLERGQERTFCIVCAYISFEGDARGQQHTEYKHYLMTTPIPRPGDSRSFYEFTSGLKPTPEDVEEASTSTDFIDTDKEYVVLFTYGKRKGYWDRFNIAGAAAIGGGIIAGVASFFTFGTAGIVYAIIAGTTFGGVEGLVQGPDLYINWTSAVGLYELSMQEFIGQECTTFGQ